MAGLLSAVRRPSGVVIALAVVVAVLGLHESYRAAGESSLDRPFETPPERPTHHDLPLAGGEIDESYEVVVDPDPDLSNREYRRHRDQVRGALREAAVEALADARGLPTEAARERVETGEWTDDARVAAFLGEQAPPAPASVRLGDWLSGERDRRRIAGALAEIRAIAAVPETGPTDATELADGSDRSDGVSPTDGHGRPGRASLVTDDSIHGMATITAVDASTRDASGWDPSVVAAFLLVGAGFVLRATPLVLGAVVALTFTVYGRVTRPPAMAVEVSRFVEDGSPVPGGTVEVTLTVENVGDHPVAEVRAVDGVPGDLPVTGGTPRLCGSLHPGESLSTSYTVEALRGEHAFGTVRVWTRNVTGEIEREATAELTAALTCQDPVDAVPIGSQTTPYAGRIPTDAGGQGMEFYATREYQSSDPLEQIDWNSWARTGEPRTIEFRQHRAATFLVLLDDRVESVRSRREWSPDAVSLGRYAAVRMADSLLDDMNAVGAATLRNERYEAPDRGRQQLEKIRTLLFEDAGIDPEDLAAAEESDEESDDPEAGDSQQVVIRVPESAVDGSEIDARDLAEIAAGSGDDSEADGEDSDAGETRSVGDGGIALEWFRRRLPGDAQVVFVTPMLDGYPEHVARRLQAEGHEVTVLSPNVTTTETPGGTISRIKRHERLRRLRRRGFGVVDWPAASPLSVELERARERWSQ